MTPKTPGPALRGARRFAFAALACLLVSGCIGGGESDRVEPAPAPTTLPLADLVAAAAPQVRDGGALRIGVSSFPATFNPVHADGVASTAPQILDPTLGAAVRVLEDGRWSVDPDYASAVRITDRDPLTIRVELNRRAVWQGGTPITSADMVSFVDAMQGDEFAAAAAPVFDDVDRVEPDGRFAYEVVFDAPNADWPAAIYPALPRAYTKSADTFNTAMRSAAPSSNGPFLVRSIERATGTITLGRNPRWWGDPPKLESIVWRIGEPEVLARAFLAGELDAVPVMPASLAELASADLRASRGSDWTQVTLNGGRGPLADAAVRQAISLAIDRDRIVTDTTTRYGAPAELMDSVALLPGQVGHRPVDQGRDLAAADRLLTEAGWLRSTPDAPRERDGEPLTLSMAVPDTRTGSVQRAESIVEDLAELGVQVQVSQTPGAAFFEDVVIPLDFDLTTFAWHVEPFGLSDVRRLFTPIDGSLNFTGKASKAIGTAFDAAVAELDDERRSARIAEVDTVARAQASIIPLALIPRVMAVDPTVVNYGPTALADLDWTLAGFAAEDD